MADTFGFDAFIDSLDEIEEDFKQATRSLLEQTGDLAVAETQSRTPVGVGTPLPGNLRRRMTRSDIEEVGTDMRIEVGNDAEYAEAVEEGHRTRNGGFVVGRHMLRDGVAVASRRFDRKAKEIFEDITKGFNL